MEINRLACKYYDHNTAEIIRHFTELPFGQAETGQILSHPSLSALHGQQE